MDGIPADGGWRPLYIHPGQFRRAQEERFGSNPDPRGDRPTQVIARFRDLLRFQISINKKFSNN